jgi:hypothetical protein
MLFSILRLWQGAICVMRPLRITNPVIEATDIRINLKEYFLSAHRKNFCFSAITTYKYMRKSQIHSKNLDIYPHGDISGIKLFARKDKMNFNNKDRIIPIDMYKLFFSLNHI